MGTFGTKQSPKSWENDLRSSMKPPSFGGAADSKKYFDDEPASENYSQDPEDSVLKKGDKVRHAHFGEGFVVTITGTGQSAKIMVDFASVGRKQLMLAFAKLQKT
jgi:DNA helicase-2/ATP-dependent DNA helicase PcrA